MHRQPDAASSVRLTAAVALLAALATAWFCPASSTSHADPPRHAAPPTSVNGFEPFSHWPKQKPEIVFVISGQTFGYLSPCGCSSPQRGGLERRANLMDSLRAKGWPVAGLDLGDIAPPRKVLEQDLLKYKAAMESLRTMGYVAVGLGEYDFHQQLFELLAAYTLHHLDDPRPVILCANLAGRGENGAPQPREQVFASGPGQRPMVDDVQVIQSTPDGIPCPAVGIVATIGRSVAEKIAQADSNFTFLDNGAVLQASLAKLDSHPAKPALRVLLYAGSLEEARKLAEAFPQFQLIVCQIAETEPPQFPTMVNAGKTMIVQVGHKGQNVGAVGVYRGERGFELKYQLISLGEQYLTPKDQVAGHKVLAILENYTREVKDRNLLAKYLEKPMLHPAMIQQPKANLTYVGVERCKSCHPNEAKIWSESKHSHAYTALVDYAVNPGNRQFDGDCVSCHTTGFGYQGGFTSETATPHLLHNGCENCHGPGSGHAADPKNKALLALLKPWISGPEDQLPRKEILEKMGKLQPGEPLTPPLSPHEQKTYNAVSSMCMRCHDGENDPHFNLSIYMPKIWHSGFKAQASSGLPDIAK